ncbi:MAG: tRNA pseudouridine(65) synthase TruC [Thiovulaceae bacterium]|nr:tRNA pseudouridine(65) synthase TruC [Sulfurimonadaceae bacterium]
MPLDTDAPLEVLFHDDYLIVVNKPSGLLVHRSMIDRHETEFALQKVRDQIGQFVYPIHRLDKPTSGVLVFALSKEIARLMSELLKTGETVKEYIAVVRGYIDEEGIIDYPLKEQLDKMTDAKVNKNKEAQSAVTDFKRLATVEIQEAVGRYQSTRYSLVKLFPKTGRKHQLRRHMKHIMHPIVGDTKHGRGEHNKFFRSSFDSHRLLLHAIRMCFIHPVTGEELNLRAPIEHDFAKVLQALAWNDENLLQ